MASIFAPTTRSRMLAGLLRRSFIQSRGFVAVTASPSVSQGCQKVPEIMFSANKIHLRCGFQALAQEKMLNVQKRAYSSYTQRDDISSEEDVGDAERGAGWLLKLIFAGTAIFFGLQFFPFMGENVMQQSVALLRVKDPLFKRMGASRLSRFAYNDDKRRRIVEMGGIAGLVSMLESATDDCTRREAMKALASLSVTDTAIVALHDVGADSMISSITESTTDDDILKYRSILMKRLHESEFFNTDGEPAADMGK